jgi:hypothetical protein
MLVVEDTHPGRSIASKNPPKRGTISGISSKSRYRLIKILAKVSRPDSCLFITLTYRNFTDEFTTWKSHLNRFGVSLNYHFPDHSAVWRMEFQDRGAPHFHILLWPARDTNVVSLRDELAKRWCKIIGQETSANLEYGVTVGEVTDFRASAFYLSVYQAKDAQDRDDIATGREWGLWHRERLGLEPIKETAISDRQFLLFRRVLRRHYSAFMRRSGAGVRHKQGGKSVVRSYLRALRRHQVFSNFLPFAVSHQLLSWCAVSCSD